MDLIPPTRLALDSLAPESQVEFGDDLRLLARQAEEVVPTLLGVSVTSTDNGLTFTLVAVNAESALLDAVQYLDDGPCVAGVRLGEALQYDDAERLDEEGWRLFAHASAAHGIQSTLSLPIMIDDRAVGSINLYASEPGAFEGLHGDLAAVFGAWAEGAVTNADLSFSTRGQADLAPERIRDLDEATRLLAQQAGVEEAAARDLIRDASRRAGVTQADLARTVLDRERDRDREAEQDG